jgi:PPK2 family polyphosphate:nucleotide phosphotransferase
VPSLTERLRFDPSQVDRAVSDDTAGATPGVKNRKAAERELAELSPRLLELQEALYAEGHAGGRRRLILLLQGTDTSGKDGAVKHVLSRVNPVGLKVTAFGKPTPEELAHDFLWRVTNAVPPPGYLGVFNRSQYEDVLVVRVHDLVPPEQWEQRYDLINAWEAEQVAAGVTFLKVYLHISRDEQRERLLARIADVRKHWKVNPGDIVERGFWEDYRSAYAAMLTRGHTDHAPWHVLPADHKWYRNWALGHLLVETLEAMDPQWPVRPELDLAGMRASLGG